MISLRIFPIVITLVISCNRSYVYESSSSTGDSTMTLTFTSDDVSTSETPNSTSSSSTSSSSSSTTNDDTGFFSTSNGSIIPFCGNGVLEKNEECDNGPLNDDLL